MKYFLLALLFAGCSEVVNQGEVQTDAVISGISVNINYRDEGRVFNLSSKADSVTYGNDFMLIYSDRVTQIHKDSLINYIIK